MFCLKSLLYLHMVVYLLDEVKNSDSGKFALQNVGRYDWVRSQNDSMLGGVRIGMDCMNLVTAISRYTHVPV